MNQHCSTAHHRPWSLYFTHWHSQEYS